MSINRLKIFIGVVLVCLCINMPVSGIPVWADDALEGIENQSSSGNDKSDIVESGVDESSIVGSTDNSDSMILPEGTVLDEEELAELTESEFPVVYTDGSLYSTEKAGANAYAYETLNDTQKEVFNCIGEKLEEFIASSSYTTELNAETSNIVISYTLSENDSLSEDEFTNTVYRFGYANPKYYWLDGNYSYGVHGKNYLLTFKVNPYYYSYAARKEVDDSIADQLDTWVDEIKGIAGAKDNFYAALKLHDLIINNIDYAYESGKTPQSAKWAHSIAGVFTGQGAVCEGYAKTFEYVLTLAGIPNVYILGTGKNEAHAWNAVQMDDKWYLCDVTWDDPNKADPNGFNNAGYTYFFMPSSLFSKSHRPYAAGYYGLYDVPTFADDLDESFFGRFKCYSSEGFSKDNAEEFANQVITNRYTGSDYIYVMFPRGEEKNFVTYVEPYITGKESSSQFMYYTTDYGSMMIYEAPIISAPSDKIELDKEELTLEAKEEAVVNAVLSEGSDDRVIWTMKVADDTDTYPASRYVTMTTKGTKAVIKGLRDGKVILTATLYSSTLPDSPKVLSASCEITVGTGVPSADATVWQNGYKNYKKITLSTNLRATNWKDDKGKVKKGKMVWFVSDSSVVPSFEGTSHKVSFGTKSKNASVNNKGVLTAKKAGKVYVYACDTGSMNYEVFEVDILAAPSKVYLSGTPGSTDKDTLMKKENIEANSILKVYITPFLKDGTASEECTYKVKVSKPEQAKYVSISEIDVDEKGNQFFTIKGVDFDHTKNKPASVKIDVICDQSNKKVSMTAVVSNPVFTAKLEQVNSSAELKLTQKGDSLSFKLVLDTYIDNMSTTTDKIKIYVGKTLVTFNENDKVTSDKGATVKAKFDAKTMNLVLTASKDAGVPAVVSAAFTNPANKEITLIDIAKVDEQGNVTLL